MAPHSAGYARVVFDDAAFGDDLRGAGSEIAAAARRAYEQRGVLLAYLAFGVRHHPRDSNALTVYEIAHRRLHE
jgi:hypothetical protein